MVKILVKFGKNYYARFHDKKIIRVVSTEEIRNSRNPHWESRRVIFRVHRWMFNAESSMNFEIFNADINFYDITRKIIRRLMASLPLHVPLYSCTVSTLCCSLNFGENIVLLKAILATDDAMLVFRNNSGWKRKKRRETHSARENH